jgi:tetratricopeptide (TPR) repeat protein
MEVAAEKLLAEAMQMEDERAAARSSSTAAFMLLCCGHTERAAELLQRIIETQGDLNDDRGRAISELRLVQVLQRLGHVDQAVHLARGVVARTSPHSSIAQLNHFALHHLGKALVQNDALPEARQVLLEALRPREQAEDRSLADSTRVALAMLELKEGTYMHRGAGEP